MRGENFPLLTSDEIHIWQVSTIVSPDEIVEYKNVLSENELAKVTFFEFKQVQNSFVISQGALRMLLSGYLEIPAKSVKLGRRSKGKPYSIDNPTLFFNMSHSGKLVVIAFSLKGELGIDVEQIRPLPDLDDMIARNFTPREIKFINAQPDEKINRFFRFWTIKESYLKAIGEGMRLSPDNLEFAIENDQIRQVSIKGFFDQEDWKFKEFSSSTDYVGTISYNQNNAILKHMEFK